MNKYIIIRKEKLMNTKNFNDAIIGRDGKISLSFAYELENINEYFIRLNVAAEYIKDMGFYKEIKLS